MKTSGDSSDLNQFCARFFGKFDELKCAKGMKSNMY